MMFFKSISALSALLVLVSAMTFERSAPVNSETSISTEMNGKTPSVTAHSFALAKGDCDKEDEDDCIAYCTAVQQTATCTASGNKVTCYCKGGKTPESNCEERCLLCMPGKAAFEEASRVFKLGAVRQRIEEL